jgi:hypothetical protein
MTTRLGSERRRERRYHRSRESHASIRPIFAIQVTPAVTFIPMGGPPGHFDSLTVAAPLQWGTHHFHRLGVNGPPVRQRAVVNAADLEIGDPGEARR